MVLVVLENEAGRLRKSALELLAAGRELAAAKGTGLAAVALGPGAAQAAAAAGGLVDRALAVEDEALATYATLPYTRALAAAQAQTGAELVLLAATAFGRDLAPRLAARLGAGFAADVTSVRVEEGRLVFVRPVYAGKALAEVVVTTPLAVATIRPNTFPRAELGAAGAVESLTVAFPPEEREAAFVTTVEAAGAGRVELTEADVVVAGGRGLKAPENFRLVEELADALGGAVGASRAVVDAGWRPHHEQVGQTGKVVAPALYVAVGISGAVQHLAGMSAAKVIVAVNRDPEAPIFKVADYGIVGDALEVLPLLTDAVRRLRG
jgi:electron transfer flavoprotein alpha subunit